MNKTERFIEKATNVHGDKYDYSKVNYINSTTKVCIICPKHGEFWQTPSNHLQGSKCPKCSNIDVHKKQSNGKNGFIKKAISVHGDKYDYSKVEYINNKTKVCIICPKHGEFWQRPDKHLQGRGCPVCGGTKKLTKCEFVKQANLIHNWQYDYSKVNYTNNRTKVCIICPEHGEFWQTPHSHLRGQGCPICKSNLKLTTEEFIERSKIIHNNHYDYSKVKYINYETKVCIICPKHGEFWQTPHGHLSGQGCPKCVGLNKTTEDWVKEAKDIHNETYDYSKVRYINNEEKVCIVCPKHGEFWQSPHNHLRGQGCPSCVKLSKSKLSQIINTFLTEKKISFVKEKTFTWLKDKGNLYLDFYLPQYNAAIECQGIQHFEMVEYFGGVEGFKRRQELDRIKYELCKEHGIKVFYFSKTEEDFLDKIYINEKTLLEDICKQVK